MDTTKRVHKIEYPCGHSNYWASPGAEYAVAVKMFNHHAQICHCLNDAAATFVYGNGART